MIKLFYNYFTIPGTGAVLVTLTFGSRDEENIGRNNFRYYMHRQNWWTVNDL